MIQRAFASVFATDLPAVRDFYVSLFGWKVAFDSDWFVHLQAAVDENIELGIVRRDHEIVPEAFRDAPRGTMITIVVDDVDALHRTAEERGIEVVEAPRNLFYGQRRMVLRDPARDDGRRIQRMRTRRRVVGDARLVIVEERVKREFEMVSTSPQIGT